MNNDLGVMQGRLLPKFNGRYQAHPTGFWKEEFEIASDLGLQCIEFIIDKESINENPLLKENGIEDIKKTIYKTGVNVKTICADYFMDFPIQSLDFKVSENSQNILIKLISNANELGVSDIIIPCVDHASLNDEESIKLFVEKLNPLVSIADNHKINLCLETDLNPKMFRQLLNSFNSNRITVNYDIGNSASLGYDPVEELECYGDKITDVHIKDRKLGGKSVILGKGSADFDSFFKKLKSLEYDGPFILQAYRDDKGLEIFKKQLNWIKRFL